MDDFTIIPNDLYEALRNGEITLCMFQTMVFLHKWASWDTGVARKVRAGRMVLEQGEEGFSQRTYQKSLQQLHNSGRITSGHQAGSRKSYPVTINNYRALTGARKNQILNPHQIEDWHDSDEREGANEGAEGYAESYAEDYAERATIQELHKNLDKSLNKSSQKKHSLPTSLPLASSKAEKIPAEQNGGEPDWEQITNDESDELTGYARATAIYVANHLLGKGYCRKYEAFLPQFKELFSGYENDLGWRRGFILGFVKWILAHPKLATKFLTMKDFFFHFNNQSGSEEGLIWQYEAFVRASAPVEEEISTVPSDSPKRKVVARAMTAMIEDGVLVKNISVDEL